MTVWGLWLGLYGWGSQREAGPMSTWPEPLKWLLVACGTVVGVGLLVAGFAWLIGMVLFHENVLAED